MNSESDATQTAEVLQTSLSNTQEENPVIEQTPVTPKEETPEDQNWKAFRLARKKDREEKEQAERIAREKAAEAEALKKAMEAVLSRPAPVTHQYEDQYEETEEQRLEKKINAMLEARSEAERQRQREIEAKEMPQRLNQMFPDFESVVTSDHLDYLEYHYPEVAAPLKKMADGLDKWSDIYRAVRRFVPNIHNSSKDANRAADNLVKPKSISSPTITQQTNPSPNILSDERKAANWQRMQRALKGLA